MGNNKKISIGEIMQSRGQDSQVDKTNNSSPYLMNQAPESQKKGVEKANSGSVTIEMVISKLQEKGGDFIAPAMELSFLVQTINSLGAKQDVNDILNKLYSENKLNNIKSYIGELNAIIKKYREEVKETSKITVAKKKQAFENLGSLTGKIKVEDLPAIISELEDIIDTNKELSPSEKKHLVEAVGKLKNLQEGQKEIKVRLGKVEKALDTTLSDIEKTNFPGEVTIFGKQVFFDKKEDAIEAIRIIKEGLKDQTTGMDEVVFDLTIYSLISLVSGLGKKFFDTQYWVFKKGFLGNINEYLDKEDGHFSNGDPFLGILYDGLPAALTVLFLANLNIFLVTAIATTTGKFFKDVGGRMGMGVMEDYSSRPMGSIDASSIEAQHMFEYQQREAIMEVLRERIDGMTEGDKKVKFEKDLQLLERYKLVNTDTFYYKAYLISKDIGLKNFMNLEYYYIRALSLADGGRFVFPWKNNFPETSWLRKIPLLYMTEGVAFSKTKLTPEINGALRMHLNRVQEGLNRYYDSSVEVNNRDGKLTVEHGHPVSFENNDRYKNIIGYIDSLDIEDEEKQRRKRNLKGFFNDTASKKQLYLQKTMEMHIYDIVGNGYITRAEFQSGLEANDNIRSLLEDPKIYNLLEGGTKNPFWLQGNKKRLADFIILFNKGKWKGNQESLIRAIGDFNRGLSINERLGSRLEGAFDTMILDRGRDYVPRDVDTPREADTPRDVDTPREADTPRDTVDTPRDVDASREIIDRQIEPIDQKIRELNNLLKILEDIDRRVKNKGIDGRKVFNVIKHDTIISDISTEKGFISAKNDAMLKIYNEIDTLNQQKFNHILKLGDIEGKYKEFLLNYMRKNLFNRLKMQLQINDKFDSTDYGTKISQFLSISNLVELGNIDKITKQITSNFGLRKIWTIDGLIKVSSPKLSKFKYKFTPEQRIKLHGDVMSLKINPGSLFKKIF